MANRPPGDKKPRHAIVDLEGVRQMLLQIDEYCLAEKQTVYMRIALLLEPYIGLRMVELTGGCWEEVNFEKRKRVIPASRMKTRKEHIVFLSNQALDLLKKLEYERQSPFCFLRIPK